MDLVVLSEGHSWERISADVRDHTVELSVFWRVIGLGRYSLHLFSFLFPFGRIGSRERASARIRPCPRGHRCSLCRLWPSSAERAKGISFGIHVPADCGNESTRSRFPVHRVQTRSSTTRFLSYLALSLPLFPYLSLLLATRFKKLLGIGLEFAGRVRFGLLVSSLLRSFPSTFPFRTKVETVVRRPCECKESRKSTVTN